MLMPTRLRELAFTWHLSPRCRSWVVLAALGCSCGRASPLAPSAIIVPDAITVRTGDIQTFTVQNADVASFLVRYDRGDWTDVVRIDAIELGSHRIRIIALRPTTGYVYVMANVGDQRTPLVAVLTIQ